MKLLAQNGIPELFGTIPPPISGMPTDAAEGIGNVISVAIQLFILLAFLGAFVYLLWGAYEWVISGGDKELLSKAQKKITNATVGMLVMVTVISIFVLITNTVFGGKVIWFDATGMHFKIPTVGP